MFRKFPCVTVLFFWRIKKLRVLSVANIMSLCSISNVRFPLLLVFAVCKALASSQYISPKNMHILELVGILFFANCTLNFFKAVSAFLIDGW
jgi:hypothetical protein